MFYPSIVAGWSNNLIFPVKDWQRKIGIKLSQSISFEKKTYDEYIINISAYENF